MTSFIESSVVVAFARRMARGSALCGALLKFTRPVAGALVAAEGQIGRLIPPRDEAAERTCIDALLKSGVARAVRTAAARLVGAARESMAARSVSLALAPIRVLEIDQRVRLAGWMLLVALVTRVLLGEGLDESALTDAAIAGWTVALLVAVGLLTGCKVIARAWLHRRGVQDPNLHEGFER